MQGSHYNYTNLWHQLCNSDTDCTCPELTLPLSGLGLHCDALKEIFYKETSAITGIGVVKSSNMNVVCSGYAQVYVQYYSIVLLWGPIL